MERTAGDAEQATALHFARTGLEREHLVGLEADAFEGQFADVSRGGHHAQGFEIGGIGKEQRVCLVCLPDGSRNCFEGCLRSVVRFRRLSRKE